MLSVACSEPFILALLLLAGMSWMVIFFTAHSSMIKVGRARVCKDLDPGVTHNALGGAALQCLFVVTKDGHVEWGHAQGSAMPQHGRH